MDASLAQHSHSRRQTDPVVDYPYNYIPTLYVGAIFISLFGLTTSLHLFQAIRRRMWWLIPTMVACGLTESIGWAGRLWSSKNPTLQDPFLMQITTTIIAPTFMTAAMFVTLSRVITAVGTEFSRLRPKWYTIIFITADVTALVIQAVGGATASMADTNAGSEKGAKIMVGGIIVQMVAITIYAILASEYLFRVYTNRPLRPADGVAVPLSRLQSNNNTASALTFTGEDSEQKLPGATAWSSKLTHNLKMMLVGLVIATILIYIRSVYRTIELLDGWNGSIISNERLFNLLDATPVFLAMFTLNVFHPGRLLPPAPEDAEKTEVV